MTNWLKGDFSLKFYFRRNTFWSKFRIKISNKPVFRKVFWVQFARKISLLDISGAKIFFWEGNFKISYFDISIDKMICFEKYIICENHAKVVLLYHICLNIVIIIEQFHLIEKTNNFFLKNVFFSWIFWTDL
jgi:hypothetical protein